MKKATKARERGAKIKPVGGTAYYDHDGRICRVFLNNDYRDYSIEKFMLGTAGYAHAKVLITPIRRTAAGGKRR